MKKLKFLMIGAISLLATSCLVDDEDSTNANGLYNSPNIANFTENNINLILTPTSSDQEYSTRVNYITDLPLTGAATFTYAVNTTETTIASTDYEVLTNPSFVYEIAAGEEVANGYFDYKIIAENIPTGEVNYLVIDLIKVSGASNIVGGKLIVTIEKCDPVLIGAYTAANTLNGSSNGDGEAVEIIALNCNTYQASNLPNFNSIQYFDFILNDDNTITLTGTLSNFSNIVSGSGVLLANGTIQIDDFDIEDNTQDMSFDLVPN